MCSLHKAMIMKACYKHVVMRDIKNTTAPKHWHKTKYYFTTHYNYV